MRAGFDAATRGAKESFQIARYGEQGAIQKGMRKIGSTRGTLSLAPYAPTVGLGKLISIL